MATHEKCPTKDPKQISWLVVAYQAQIDHQGHTCTPRSPRQHATSHKAPKCRCEILLWRVWNPETNWQSYAKFRSLAIPIIFSYLQSICWPSFTCKHPNYTTTLIPSVYESWTCQSNPRAALQDPSMVHNKEVAQKSLEPLTACCNILHMLFWHVWKVWSWQCSILTTLHLKLWKHTRITSFMTVKKGSLPPNTMITFHLELTFSQGTATRKNPTFPHKYSQERLIFFSWKAKTFQPSHLIRVFPSISQGNEATQ